VEEAPVEEHGREYGEPGRWKARRRIDAVSGEPAGGEAELQDELLGRFARPRALDAQRELVEVDEDVERDEADGDEWRGTAGNVIFQGTAGEAADTTDMTFDEKSIVATGTIACSSFTVTVPAS